MRAGHHIPLETLLEYAEERLEPGAAARVRAHLDTGCARCAGELAVTYHKSVLRTGTTRSRDVSARIGVTSDGAETLPGSECDSGKAPTGPKPPVKRRVKTHTGQRSG